MNFNGHPSYIKIAPKPFHEASHYKTKDLENSGATKTGVLHMACFKMENAFYVASFHENAFFFSRDVKGASIFP